MYLVAPGAISLETAPGATVVVGGEEGRHAVVVKRTGVGESILLSDGAGLVADAVVSHVEGGELVATVQGMRREEIAGPRFTLVQALAKGDRDLQAVESATELGADRIVPWQAERAIVQWKGERAAKAHRKWVATATAATKQSRRAAAPLVDDLMTRKDLSRLTQDAALVLVLHEDGERTLPSVEMPESGEVVLVVGPEGGITPTELEAFETAGAVVVRMGTTVLRASSAGPAALAALLARTRWV